jgi:hypothetical protein
MGVAQTMNTQTTNTARDYCRGIARELDALEFILTTAGNLDPATAEDIAAAYAELGQENTNDDYEAPLTWLNESCLDLKVLRTDDREQTRSRNLAHLRRPVLRNHTGQQRRLGHSRDNLRRIRSGHNPKPIPEPIRLPRRNSTMNEITGALLSAALCLAIMTIPLYISASREQRSRNNHPTNHNKKG